MFFLFLLLMDIEYLISWWLSKYISDFQIMLDKVIFSWIEVVEKQHKKLKKQNQNKTNEKLMKISLSFCLEILRYIITHIIISLEWVHLCTAKGLACFLRSYRLFWQGLCVPWKIQPSPVSCWASGQTKRHTNNPIGQTKRHTHNPIEFATPTCKSYYVLRHQNLTY